MAATWTFDPQIKNLAQREVSILGTRTAGDNDVRTYRIGSFIIRPGVALAVLRDEVLAQFQAMVLGDKSLNLRADEMLAGYAAGLKTAMDQWEIDNG